MGWFRRKPRVFSMPVPPWERRAIEGAGSPLAPELEAMAMKLVQIGRDPNGLRRDEVRAIGEQLNRRGGRTAMLEVIHRADAVARQRTGEPILRPIERTWDGIGDWQG
jgi:hypothetical protein